jgi:hypothetical protein
MKILILICMLAATAMVSWLSTGCKGSMQTADSTDARGAKGVATQDPVDSALERLDPRFTITQLDARRYSLNFTAGAGGAASSPAMIAIRSINSLAVQIYSGDGTQLASLATQDVNTSGTVNTAGGGASVMAYGGIEWVPEKPIQAGTYALMSIRSEKGAFSRRVDFPARPIAARPADILAMSIESSDRAGGVEFALEVRRLLPAPEGEYLATGETFRIELLNDVGETIWSSSRGKMFTQNIGSVEPSAVGATVTHRAPWDGRDYTTRGKAAPGVYRIVATIPARPTPYIIREEFTWSGK